ncbi:protein PRRC1-like [Ischnura elegans]|uniref:protein PRRC1-like n=1 Tax=Ischnura elegans TaxID=197161 RepID=UPI001ED89709|nr:protein PRRC1-like [Ischnura elegans]
MQEDSNGESSFEFVDKKVETMSLSDVMSKSSVEPRSGLMYSENSAAKGTNLLSSLSPPSTLPSFAIPSPPVTQSKDEVTSGNISSSLASTQIGALSDAKTQPITVSPIPASLPQVPAHVLERANPKFSAAIPPSKGTASSPETHGTKEGQNVDFGHEGTPGLSGRGLMGWVKDAVGSSGGLLSKVAEKAKNSVDSMITTLDPQMKEFLYSGGDMDVIVASDKEVKVSPIREAFQTVFGRATVVGVAAQPSVVAAQPVGFMAGVKGAQERIAALRALPPRSSSSLAVDDTLAALVAVESFLVEATEERWYEVSVIVLSDKHRGIELHTYTQMTPVPASIVAQAQAETPKDYPLSWSGLSVTIGSLMAKHLQVDHTEWHQMLTGVSRREMLLTAARTLAGLYKNSLAG